MPWKPEEARRFKRDLTERESKQWAEVANRSLAAGDAEGVAVRKASGAVNRARAAAAIREDAELLSGDEALAETFVGRFIAGIATGGLEKEVAELDGEVADVRTPEQKVMVFHKIVKLLDRLIQIAAERGRKTRPDIKLGICGEHGGDPASIAFCEQVGLDYVSASPFRVPIARLAAAQAALGK